MCGALQNLLAVLCVVGLSAFITILVLLIAVCVCGNHEIIDCFWFPLPEVGICAILSIRKSHRAKGGFAPPVFAEGSSSPPDGRKEGDANVCYIL